MKVLFRCDGGNIKEFGTGHIARDLLLANELSKKGAEVAFAIKRDDIGYKKLRQSRYQVFQLSKKRDFLKVLKAYRADIAVVDCLDDEVSNMTKIKKISNSILIALDTSPGTASTADIRINGMINDKATPFSGYDYIVLPKKRIGPKTINKKCVNVFVNFGGYDHNQLTMKALLALKHFKRHIRFHFVSGQNNAKQIPLSSFTDKRIKHYHKLATRQFDQLLAASDLAVLAGGITLYQALSLGIPSIVMSQYRHQANAARLLEQKGVVLNLGHGKRVKTGKILNALNGLIDNHEKRKTMSLAAQSLVTRTGLNRVVDLILMVKPLPWDSNFFKQKIARLVPTRINKNIINYAMRFCRDRKTGCLYYLTEFDDTKSQALAVEHDFEEVDTKLTLMLDLEQNLKAVDIKHDNALVIRESIPSDIKRLREIAKQSYTLSRYYYDQNFSRELCAKFYSLWIAKSCRGWAQKVFVAVYQGKPVGYITCNCEGSLKGTLPLVGVSPQFRGLGIGKRLIGYAISWFKKRGVRFVDVVTQDRNREAKKLYESCGFLLSKKQIWYHKWFN